MNLKAKNHLISIEELLGEFEKRADSGLINSFDDVEDLIIEMPSGDPWISCDDQMPEEGVRVLVTVRGSDVIVIRDGEMLEQAIKRIWNEVCYTIIAVWYGEQERWFGEFGGPMAVNPVAWMPLPEPYKGEPAE